MLRRYTWEKAKEKLQHYRRRQPETSVLYQIVYHSRDDLLYHGSTGSPHSGSRGSSISMDAYGMRW